MPCKFKCYISKSKLVLSECNDLYFIAIAFIAFTLHEIKQSPGVFFWEGGGTPGIITAPNHDQKARNLSYGKFVWSHCIYSA
jgi:hypothetical protein